MFGRLSLVAGLRAATVTDGVLLPYQVGQGGAPVHPASLEERSVSTGDRLNEELISPAYVTMLRHPRIPTADSLSEGESAVEAQTYNRVSNFQLKELRRLQEAARRERASLSQLGRQVNEGDGVKKGDEAKKDDEYQSTDEIPKTVLTSLAATEYVGAIGIGTVHEPKGCDSLVGVDVPSATCRAKEQQTLKVVFDTGSTNLWMASMLCTEGPCVSGDRQRYDQVKSETYGQPAKPRNLTINFATATLLGPVGIDQFHIGPFTVMNQTFGLIQEEKGNTFAELPLEGIVGLAFPSMSAGGVPTFFDNVIEQKLLKKNLFAFYLSPNDVAHSASFFEGNSRYQEYKPGMDAILWGGVDKRLYEGELAWFPVTQAHYWATDLYAFYIGDKKMSFTDDGDVKDDDGLLQVADTDVATAPAKLIVDSGTAYYTAEDYLYHSFMSEMKCDGSKPPNLTYRLKDVNGNPHDLVLTSEDYMVSHCEPGYVKIPVPKKYGPAMLLGELFMRKYFTVFDRGDGSDTDGRIGIARSKPGADVGTKLSSEAAPGQL